MLKWLFLLCITMVFLSGCTTLPVIQPSVSAAADTSLAVECAVTQPFQDQPPDDPHADPFAFGNWHINADRTIWVNLPPDGSWGTAGEKVIWIRPAGTELKVSGQRLDAEAVPLQADIPCCYPTGFQVTGLTFPTEGCWEVIATAGEHELRFITQVKGAEKAMDKATTTNPSAAPSTAVECAVTEPVQDEPPKDPNADPFGFGYWYTNADSTIWMNLPPTGTWKAGGEKVLWIRPAGTDLQVSGRRLDAETAPLRADIPCCYPTTFQVSSLIFPTGGCWEVTATAGDHELQFTMRVDGPDQLLESGPCPPLALDKQYLFFLQENPWRLVCAQGSVFEVEGTQATPRGDSPLWPGGKLTDLRDQIDNS